MQKHIIENDIKSKGFEWPRDHRSVYLLILLRSFLYENFEDSQRLLAITPVDSAYIEAFVHWNRTKKDITIYY